MANSEILPLFPTFLWKTQLSGEGRVALDSAIGAKLGELRAELPRLETGDAWQSDPDLHLCEALAELIAQFREGGNRVLDFLKVGGQELVVTGCWANVSAPKARHPRHNHPNNFLSGIYYHQTPSGADTVQFHDPRPQTGAIRPAVTELTGYNTDQVVVQIAPGDLLLFPAWLEHSVPPNGSGQERISLSANLMFASYTERLTQPLWEGGICRFGD